MTKNLVFKILHPSTDGIRMTQTIYTEKMNDKAREEIFKIIPLGKLGTPKDVAGVCLFLASSHADYITGQTIIVDGGLGI